jgi:hypothetical protein
MSKPLPKNYNPIIGDVVIGKYAKLDGSVNPRVVIGFDSWDYMNDCVVTVDKDGEIYTAELKRLKYVVNPIIKKTKS